MNGYYQLAWHHGSVPALEWGSAPRGPLVALDMAHQGELLGQVMGVSPLRMPYQVLRCEICVAVHVWPLPPVPREGEYRHRALYEGADLTPMFRYAAWPTEWLLHVAASPLTHFRLTLPNLLCVPGFAALAPPHIWWAWTPKTLELALRWTGWQATLTCHDAVLHAVATRRPPDEDT